MNSKAIPQSNAASLEKLNLNRPLLKPMIGLILLVAVSVLMNIGNIWVEEDSTASDVTDTQEAFDSTQSTAETKEDCTSPQSTDRRIKLDELKPGADDPNETCGIPEAKPESK